MATLTDAARNAMVDALTALIDNGDVRFETSANNEVALLNLAADSFGAAASGTATANTITDDTSAAGGVIDHVNVRNSGGTNVITLTAGTVGSGQDAEITNLTIGAGDTVSISSFTITMPAS